MTDKSDKAGRSVGADDSQCSKLCAVLQCLIQVEIIIAGVSRQTEGKRIHTLYTTQVR